MKKAKILYAFLLLSSIQISASEEGLQPGLSAELSSPRGPKAPVMCREGDAVTVQFLQDYLKNPGRDVLFVPFRDDKEAASYSEAGVAVVSWTKRNNVGLSGLMLTLKREYVGAGPLSPEVLHRALKQISDSCQRNGAEYYRTKETPPGGFAKNNFVVRHRTDSEGQERLCIETEEEPVIVVEEKVVTVVEERPVTVVKEKIVTVVEEKVVKVPGVVSRETKARLVGIGALGASIFGGALFFASASNSQSGGSNSPRIPSLR